VTNSAVHLGATTVPAARLAWFQGDRLWAITNLVQIEAIPVVLNDFSFPAVGSVARKLQVHQQKHEKTQA
jgi:hypothetical protein